MAVDWVDISEQVYLDWGTVLEMLADCVKVHIKPEDSGARVYPYWVYEIDIATLLGKTLPQMFATEGTSNGKVHCWTFGISSAVPILNQQGDTPEVGSMNYTWNLTLDIWGLWSYEGTSASQRLAIDEARLVAAAFKRNAQKMVEEHTKLAKVAELSYTALQPTPFSDGHLYTVASGQMQVQVNEHFTA